MRNVRFHPEAKAELTAATRWYNRAVPGLGGQFRAEVKAAVSRLSASPTAFGIIRDDIRCQMLHRFPYGVLYRIHADDVLVVAIMHLHRDPSYWENRL